MQQTLLKISATILCALSFYGLSQAQYIIKPVKGPNSSKVDLSVYVSAYHHLHDNYGELALMRGPGNIDGASHFGFKYGGRVGLKMYKSLYLEFGAEYWQQRFFTAPYNNNSWMPQPEEAEDTVRTSTIAVPVGLRVKFASFGPEKKSMFYGHLNTKFSFQTTDATEQLGEAYRRFNFDLDWGFGVGLNFYLGKGISFFAESQHRASLVYIFRNHNSRFSLPILGGGVLLGLKFHL